MAWKSSRVVSRFVRKVRTSSGAVAVQVVTRRGRRVERIEHVGSAHDDGELALLLASAGERLRPGQDALDLGEVPTSATRLEEVADWTSELGASAGRQVLDEAPDAAAAPMPPPRGRRPAAGAGGQVVATSSLVLWQVLTDAYRRLGFEALADEAFRAMVLARIIEPTSKTDSLRVLAEMQGRLLHRWADPRVLPRVPEGHRRDQGTRPSHHRPGSPTGRAEGYVSNLDPAVTDGATVIAAYHDLWQVEASFRMTKSDLRARPVFHHEREAIEAHLTVVFAALAISRDLQTRTAATIKKIVQTLRTARSATIEINGQRLTLQPKINGPVRAILDQLEPGH